METIGTWWMWAGFFAIVVAMLAVDLFVVGGGRTHRVSVREAAVWSGIWVGVSLLFAGALWWYLDGTAGRESANEKSLEFVLMFIGAKMLLIDVVKIPVLASLAVVAAVIGVSIWLSLRRNARQGVPTARPVAGTRAP